MAKLKEVIDSAAKRWMLTFPLWIIVTISLLCIFWIFGLLIDLGLPRQTAGWINFAIVGTYLTGYLAGELYVDLDRTYVDGEQSYTPGDNIKSGSLKKRILLQFPIYLFVILNILCFHWIHGLFKSLGLCSWYAYYLHMSFLCLYWFGYGCRLFRAYLLKK
ncbi:hypothetical protein [Paenibacillus lautus]|uniref:hypothetical protein n=1 Tax=Paenibacillus lautus TaxID=1401 RepID=UPI000FD760C7|nr:hypothetical protein [Paenibacillus lautus]